MKRMQGPRRRLGAKMALIVICMALVLSSAALFASYRTYETNMADLYTSSAQNLVRTLVSRSTATIWSATMRPSRLTPPMRPPSSSSMIWWPITMWNTSMWCGPNLPRPCSSSIPTKAR